MKPLKYSKSIFTSLLIVTSLLFTSCGKEDGKNVKIPGVQGPILTLIEDNIMISMVFEKLNLDFGGRFTIPQFPNSYVEIGPDAFSSGMLFAFSISLKDVLGDDIPYLDPQTLPGGRPLPGVIEGRIPAVAFTIEQFYDVTLYLGNKFLGVFVPVPHGILDFMGDRVATYRFYVEGKRAGNVSVAGPDQSGQNAGVLLLLDFNDFIKSKLKAIAKKYE